MTRSARPFQRSDASSPGATAGAPESPRDSQAQPDGTTEAWPQPEKPPSAPPSAGWTDGQVLGAIPQAELGDAQDSLDPLSFDDRPPADDIRPAADTRSADRAPAPATPVGDDTSDIDAVLDRVLAPVAVGAGPPDTGSESEAAERGERGAISGELVLHLEAGGQAGATAGHGVSTDADRAAVRATFEELAAIHIAPVRNLMLEVRWGEPPSRYVRLVRPALHSLRAMAAAMEVDDLVRPLDVFDLALGDVVAAGADTICGELRERLLGSYFPLQRSFPAAFGVENRRDGRDRREPIVIDALLDDVPGLDPATLQTVHDRLCLVGLGRLEPLLKARADEIAVVADIPRAVADRIVARVAELVASAPAALVNRQLRPVPGPGARRAGRSLEEWLTAELGRKQLLVRLRRGEQLEGVDFSGANLPGAVLEGVFLLRAELDGAQLEGAVLRRADLRHARLRGANLMGADLSDANLQSADLQGAQLDGAILTGANLSRANLGSAHLVEAELKGARLSFATLTAARLDGASLKDASLVHADLERASLEGVRAFAVDLSGAHLDGAVLQEGDFRQARFGEASLQRARAAGALLRGASFLGADLREADLARVDLRDADLTGANIDGATLTGARVAGLVPTGRPASGVRAGWIDASSDSVVRRGPAGGSRVADGDMALILTGNRQGWQPPAGERRYFGPGDFLRSAVVEFGPAAKVTIDSVFEKCVLRLAPNSELVIGANGVLVDCRILGGSQPGHEDGHEDADGHDDGHEARDDERDSDMNESFSGESGVARANVIDHGTTFKGNLSSSSTVVVLGVMEGEITGPAVEVQESGVIVGRSKISELRSRGELAGHFDAEQVELSGKVRDGTVIRARSLVVTAQGDDEGQAVFGQCEIEVGEVPSKAEAIEAFLAASRPPAPQPVAPSDPPPAPDAAAAGEAAGPTETPTPVTVTVAPAAAPAPGSESESASAAALVTDVAAAPAVASAPVPPPPPGLPPAPPEGDGAGAQGTARRGKRPASERPNDGT